MKSVRPFAACLALSLTCATEAQVSGYTFSQEIGTWQPLGGSGTLLGMPGMPPEFNFYDDNAFVSEGQNLLLGTSTTGTGWPIGFTFHFNGQAFDRVGLSTEGWLAFGNSADGVNAVYVPIGSTAYTPLSSANPGSIDPVKRNRVAGFAADLAAQGSGGLWPLQLQTAGTAPNRRFTAEWNMVRSGGSTPLSFQIRLNEGGGDPAQQTVQVIFGTMTQGTALLGQVGLGGSDPSDFNNRSVTASPYDWQQSVAGATNAANCRLPATNTYLPPGLTFTWTPAGCVVNGITITDLLMSSGSINGTLSWAPTTGASSYDYVITAGGPTDPAILSGTGITDTTVTLTGLPGGQQLVAYVRADCAPVGEWGTGLPFSTANIVEVPCGEPALSFTHCYDNLESTTWHYTSSSGAPLRLFILAGTVATGDLLRVFDGNSDQAPQLFTSANGAVAGQMITSTGGALTMTLVSDDLGSCATQDFILPLEWEIGCLDCDPVMANFNVVNDCPNGQFSVQVNVFSLGTADTATISNSADNTVMAVSGTGSYTAGPFPNGSPVVVTVNNNYNAFCSAVSDSLMNGTCPVVSCGPDNYTYCYTNNDASQFAYQSDDNGPIGIRFLSGTLAGDDALHIYDGLDPFMSTPLFSGNNGGDLTGLMVTTTAGNPDHALLLEVASDGYGSCASGQAAAWHYLIACYDGCTPPAATFTTVPNCDDQNYTVSVELGSLGSAGSVTITNDGGAPEVTANSTGTYSVGPFPVGQPVVVEVAGASELCSINSTTLNVDCGVGIKEDHVNGMHVFPNPGDGTFRLVLPDGYWGPSRLEVLDITGRSIAGRVIQGNSGRGVDCRLEDLPAGRYTLILSNGVKRAYAPITIIR